MGLENGLCFSKFVVIVVPFPETNSILIVLMTIFSSELSQEIKKLWESKSYVLAD